MKSNIKKNRYNIVKFFYSIKGLLITLFKLKIGGKYKAISLEPRKGYNVDYYYRGNRTFCYITTSCGTGIEYRDTKINQYKFWEIGVLNFR